MISFQLRAITLSLSLSRSLCTQLSNKNKVQTNDNNKKPVFWNADLTVAVADSWAEGRGAGKLLPVGCLEAYFLLLFLLLLPLLVPLLHLALAHPARGLCQKDGVITAHYGSYIKGEGRRGER